jgi:hypothetical protein
MRNYRVSLALGLPAGHGHIIQVQGPAGSRIVRLAESQQEPGDLGDVERHGRGFPLRLGEGFGAEIEVELSPRRADVEVLAPIGEVGHLGGGRGKADLGRLVGLGPEGDLGGAGEIGPGIGRIIVDLRDQAHLRIVTGGIRNIPMGARGPVSVSHLEAGLGTAVSGGGEAGGIDKGRVLHGVTGSNHGVAIGIGVAAERPFAVVAELVRGRLAFEIGYGENALRSRGKGRGGQQSGQPDGFLHDAMDWHSYSFAWRQKQPMGPLVPGFPR